MSVIVELQQRVTQLEAVIREQERTIQQESSARALAVARLKALQRRQRAQKATHARS
jgi:hypothetical protein